jgi:hypothetical protein
MVHRLSSLYPETCFQRKNIQRKIGTTRIFLWVYEAQNKTYGVSYYDMTLKTALFSFAKQKGQ